MSARKLRKFFKNSDELSVKKAQAADTASPESRMRFALTSAAMSVAHSGMPEAPSLDNEATNNGLSQSADDLLCSNLSLNQAKLSALAGIPVSIHAARSPQDFKQGILESRVDQVLADNKGGIRDLVEQGLATREMIGAQMTSGLDETAEHLFSQDGNSQTIYDNGQPSACHIFVNLDKMDQSPANFMGEHANLKSDVFENVSLTPSTRLASLLINEAQHSLRDETASPTENMAMRAAFATDTLDNWGVAEDDVKTLRHLEGLSTFTEASFTPSLFTPNHPYRTPNDTEHFAQQQAKATVLDISRQVDGPKISLEEMFLSDETSPNSLLNRMTAAYELRDGIHRDIFDEQGPVQQQSIHAFIEAGETLMPSIAKQARHLAKGHDLEEEKRNQLQTGMRLNTSNPQ